MPKQRPNSVQASTSDVGSRPVSAPMRHDVAVSAAVFPLMEAK